MLTRMDNVILSPIVFSDLLAKATSYHFNVRPITLRDQRCLVDASLSWLSDLLKGSRKPLESHLRCNMIVKTWDGFLFMVRARTPDLYTVAVAERYELEKWFKPLAKGVVVDVGAYIGTYSIRAMYSADLVVAIEPLPLNFKALYVNLELNKHRRNAKVILINKAIAEERRRAKIFLPLIAKEVGVSVASLRYDSLIRKPNYISYEVEADTLDNIMHELNIKEIDYLKIDIEGYVMKAFPGMLDTLKRIHWLQIELLDEDKSALYLLKRIGFRLRAQHGNNYLFEYVR